MVPTMHTRGGLIIMNQYIVTITTDIIANDTKEAIQLFWKWIEEQDFDEFSIIKQGTLTEVQRDDCTIRPNH